MEASKERNAILSYQPNTLLLVKFLLLLLCSTIGTIVAQDIDAEVSCPVFRKYDASQLQAPQFGDNVPPGCICREGMSEVDCGFCDSDQACHTALVDSDADNSNYHHACRQDFIFQPTDTYKSYQCALFGQLESLFTNGKISLMFNVTEGTAVMVIYNTPTFYQYHAVECRLSGCQPTLGGSSATCASVDCSCTDQCNPLTKPLIEGMLSGDAVDMYVEPLPPSTDATTTSDYQHVVHINVEGAPFAIEAQCRASSCISTPININDDDESRESSANSTTNESVPPVAVEDELPFSTQESEWSVTATVSVTILCAILVAFILLTICSVCLVPLCCGVASERKTKEGYSRSATRPSFDDKKEEGNADTATRAVEEATATTGKTTAIPKYHLQFTNVSRTVSRTNGRCGRKHKTILDKVSGECASGNVLGVMGPSGAGKSSLLNILAAVENGQVSGEILLNGAMPKNYRQSVAYVRQDDALYATLTVRECIQYSALLRLPNNMTKSEKEDYVDNALQQLHLQDVSNTRIGSIENESEGGISGGERKRVSIGMELVTDPAVLILDEPLSGLDSYAAKSIMYVLTDLAHSRDRIVILSIHQPNKALFQSMDQILLLAKGCVMYSGKPSKAKQFFERHEFPCPKHDFIADHMLDIVSDPSRLDTLANVHPEAAKASEQKENQPTTSAGGDLSVKSSFCNEVSILFLRTAKDLFRNKSLFLMQSAICSLMAVFAGGIFYDVSNNLAGFQNRMGAFYFSLSFFAFASFSSLDLFVRERHIYVRESGSQYFRAFSYFLTRTSLDLFALRVIPVTVYAFVFYFMIGFKNELEAFIIFWATLVLFNVCSGLISICISIASPTVGQANLIAAVWFLIMLLFGGFLLNVETMSPGYSWLKYLSIFYYSFEILMTNELSGMLLSFDAPGYPPLPVYGEVFLETVGMDMDNQMRDLLCLCAIAAGCVIVAYSLLLLRVPTSADRQLASMKRKIQ